MNSPSRAKPMPKTHSTNQKEAIKEKQFPEYTQANKFQTIAYNA